MRLVWIEPNVILDDEVEILSCSLIWSDFRSHFQHLGVFMLKQKWL